MDQLTLRDGSKMPVLGLGTWHHGPREEIMDAVELAIRLGYRHVDAAYIYLNEKEVGEAMARVMGNGPEKIVKREDIFITTKLWNTDHEPHLVEETCRKQMADLQVDYLDLYLMHFPTAFVKGDGNVPRNSDGTVNYGTTHYKDTWAAMEKLVEKGIVKNIGMSNFNSKQLTELMEECKILPAVLQVECNPRFTNAKLHAFCVSRGIQMVAYSSFGSPDLPWGRTDLPHILADPVIKEIADKHAKSTAQTVLRWQVEKRIGAIPKSIIKKELEENLQIFDFQLSKEEVETIDGLNKGIRKLIPIVTLATGEVVPRDQGDRFYPYREEF